MSQQCTVCKGKKTQTITATIVEWDKPPVQEDPIAIPCIWCEGTGVMTQEEIDGHQRFVDGWCKCEKDERQPKFMWNSRSARYDTVCLNCDGVLMAKMF